ncbi:MAG: hypothetical protein H0V67_11750 [Geodermatophilaceae bacterium]|nr:hypothetical protein [Geodermatophilaceae bacterium]
MRRPSVLAAGVTAAKIPERAMSSSSNCAPNPVSGAGITVAGEDGTRMSYALEDVHLLDTPLKALPALG